MEISSSLPNCSMKDLTSIAQLQPDSRDVNVLFRVLKILPKGNIVSARTRHNHHPTEIIIGDPTAKILFVLWDTVQDLECGDVFLLHDARIRMYDCSMRLLETIKSSLRKCPEMNIRVDTKRDMSKPFAWKQRKEQGIESIARSFSGKESPEDKGYCSWKEF